MKKIIVLLVLVVQILLLCSCGSTPNETSMAQTPTPTEINNEMSGDFRKSNWGDSIEQVIQVEGLPIDQSNRYLLYYGVKVLNLNTDLLFEFQKDRLVSGIYTINETHTNNQFYIDDYKKIKEELTKKYGEPLNANDEKWLRNTWENDPGMALYMSELSYFSTYDRGDEGMIAHSLSCDNFEISHFIAYYGPDYDSDYDSNVNNSGL